MPCEAYNATTDCFQPSSTPDYTYPNRIGDPAVMYANMGWVGFVKLAVEGGAGLENANILRVTSADINLSQEITMPDVIDGRIDRTAYQLGPKIVEGTLSMPLIHDTGQNTGTGCPDPSDLTVAGSLLTNVWCWATARNSHGRLVYDSAVMDIRYANHAAFRFDQCIANTLGLSVAQQDVVTLDIGVIGRGRKPAPGNQSGNEIWPMDPLGDPRMVDFLSPARVMTWNDVTVNAIGGCYQYAGIPLFYSNQVREWNLEINNNADRFYSLQGSLFPVDINVGKREVTGSLTLMGLADQLRQLSERNPEFFTQKNEMRFAFYVGTDTFGGVGDAFGSRDWLGDTDLPSHPYTNGLIFAKKLTGVVFEIETMSMTNDVFETEVNYFALASDQSCFEAFKPATSSFSDQGFPAWRS